MKTPLNGQRLQQHLTYSWWKYAILIIIGALGVNLIYTVTTYRSPADKIIDMYIYGFADEKAMQSYMDQVHEQQLAEMEEMRILLLTTDATYGSMQVSTYIAAGEGDIYILPRDEFISLASSGAWVPLEEDEELMKIMTDAEVNLQSGWRREADSGVSHLYGIPLSKLPGLSDKVMVENGYISVLLTNGNDDNVLKFLRILCRDMIRQD